jgi:hypothetical protein
MNFLYPQFLYGFLAIAIPVAIHLFNLKRYKTVYFSNNQFLKSVQQKTQSTSRLKHLLTLLARILFIVFLVLAFAQPYFPGEGKSESADKTLSLYLDNSLSMSFSSPEGQAFQRGKQKAFSILEQAAPTDKIQLISNDFKGTDRVLLSPNEAIDEIQKLRLSPNIRDFDQVRERIDNSLPSNANKNHRFIISDFQNSFLQKANSDSLKAQTNFLPVNSTYRSNVYIESLAFFSPVRKAGIQDSAQISIINTGDENISSSLEVRIDGKMQNILKADLSPGQNDTTIYFTVQDAGAHYGIIQIENDAADFDNRFHFTFEVPKAFNIVEIQPQERTKTIERIYATDEAFKYLGQSQTEPDFESWKNASALIANGVDLKSAGFWSEFESFVSQGGTGIVFPGSDREAINLLLEKIGAGTLGEADTTKKRVGTVNLEHPIFRGVFSKKPKNPVWPSITKQYRFERGAKPAIPVIKTEDDSPVLLEIEHENGKVYLWTSAIEETTFKQGGLLLPILFEMAFQSQNAGSYYNTIGEKSNLTINRSQGMKDELVKMAPIENRENKFIPQIIPQGDKLLVNARENVTESGVYEITNDTDSLLTYAAFNYGSIESELSFMNESDIDQFIEQNNWNKAQILTGDNTSLGNFVSSIGQQSSLWKWCIVLALLFLGIEILLLRFIK